MFATHLTADCASRQPTWPSVAAKCTPELPSGVRAASAAGPISSANMRRDFGLPAKAACLLFADSSKNCTKSIRHISLHLKNRTPVEQHKRT